MSVVIKKVLNRFRIVINDLKRDIFNFPFSVTLVNLIRNITLLIIPIKKVNKKFSDKREKQIFEYLYSCGKEVFDKYSNLEVQYEKSDKNYIWICWLQGEENAPEIVKKCINSVRKNCKECQITVINQNNYKEYVQLPEFIEKKYKSKKMSPAHFSDVIRVFLLKNYGGLWLDATIYCTKNIPENVFESPFFTCKSPIIKGAYISDYQWTTFVLGGQKNCIFYQFLCAFYESYWKKNNREFDYLFMDYTIALARKKIPSIDSLIEQVPINNVMRDDLQNSFNDKFDKDKFNTILNNSDTYIHKLSWRVEFSETTLDGEQTFFGYFMNNM